MPTVQRQHKTETPEPQETFEQAEKKIYESKEPETTPEGLESAEGGQESQEVSAAQETAEDASEESTHEEPVATVAVSSQATVEPDRLAQEIEVILEQDLTEMYLAMPPEKQLEFKEKGEETLSKIRVLLSSAKVNAKKIFKLIKEWLRIIPGVNRFFLEQEAKIKTDKILLVTEEEKKRGGTDLL